MSDSSSKLNFLYPKLLKPLGDNAIASIDPLSFFPGGIPEYIAPKQANFADYPFFRKNRSFKLATDISTKVKDNFSDSTYRVQKTSQDPAISLKSNIRSNLSSDFAGILNIDRRQLIVPTVKNSTVENKAIFSKQEIVSNVHNVDEGQTIIPVAEDLTTEEEKVAPKPETISNIPDLVRQQPIISAIEDLAEEETIAPKSDEDVAISDRTTITPQLETTSNSFNIVRQQPVTSAIERETVREENTAPIASDLNIIRQQPITSAVEKETITSKLNEDVAISARPTIVPKSETTSNVSNVDEQQSIVPVAEGETIAPKLDEDITSSDRTTIAPELETTSNRSDLVRQQPIASAVEEEIVTYKLSEDMNSSDRTTITPKPKTISNVPNVDEQQSLPVVEEETITSNLNEDITNRDRTTIAPQLETTSNRSDLVRQQSVTPAVEETVQEENTAPITSDLDTTCQQQPLTPAVEEETVREEIVTSKLSEDMNSSDRQTLSFKPQTNSNLPDVNNRQSIVPITEDLAVEDKSVTPIAPKSDIVRQQPVTPIVKKSIEDTTFIPKLDLFTNDRTTIASKPNKILSDLFPSNKIITPAIEHPIINQELFSPKSNNYLGLSSMQNQNYAPEKKLYSVDYKIAASNFNTINNNIILPLKIENNDRSKQNKTSETPGSNRPVDSFSSLDLSPTYSVDTSKNNLAAENKENFAENHPLPSTDVSLSNSQTSDRVVHKKASSIPDRWSNISELISESASNDNKLSTKLVNNINPDQKNVSEKNSSIDKPDSTTSLRQTDNLSFNKDLQTERSKYHISFPRLQKRESTGYERSVEKIQLATDNFKTSADRYQISKYQTNLVEKTLAEKPLVKESSDLSLSLRQDISLENQTLNEHTKTEEDEKEEERIDILAEEIYYLLQQRLERERERQGQYYR